MALLVRTAGEPNAMKSTIEREVRSLDRHRAEQHSNGAPAFVRLIDRPSSCANVARGLWLDCAGSGGRRYLRCHVLFGQSAFARDQDPHGAWRPA